MTHATQRVPRIAFEAASARVLRSSVCLSLFALVSSAQSPRVVVSTTDDVAAAAGIPFSVLDGDLVAVEAGMPVTPFLAGGHFQAVGGLIPGDIDAYAHLPGSRPGSAGGNVFSLLSNEFGFLDGDVLIFTNGGGVALALSELDLASVLGVPGANLDVDALAYDDTGRMLFSLTDNLAATVVGDVLDGDLLRLEPALSGVTRVLTEAEVQARVTQATGLTDAILDLQAVEWANGELWAAVQSPSRHDGSLIALEINRRVVIDENDMGLGGTEVDALGSLRTGDEIPVFHMSSTEALPGDLQHVETRGRAGDTLIVLMSGGTGFVNFSRLPGFGAFYMDPNDPWLLALSSAHAFPRVTLDGNGRFAADWRLPTSTVFANGWAGELGWSFQLLDFNTKAISAPFRIKKL
jgi:hypothetical protein